MADEEAAQRRQRELIEAEMARKEEELEALAALGRQAGFTPRASLARTPPQGFSTPPVAHAEPVSETQTSKRILSSPEEVQEAVRRKVNSSKKSVPPVGGILTAPPARQQEVPMEEGERSTTEQSLGKLSKLQLLDLVHQAVRGISAVANAPNKLNMADRTTIASHGQDILALVGALELQLAEAEHQVSGMKLKCTSMELEVAKRGSVVPNAPQFPTESTSVPSYAGALKMPKGKPPMAVGPTGPTVIFYPADEGIKSSEETKKALQQAIKPGTEGIRVKSVRMVGNSGVVDLTLNRLRESLLMVPIALKNRLQTIDMNTIYF